MKHDEHIPPIKVGIRNNRYVVIDGTHRLEAAKKMGLDSIRADIINEREEVWPALAVFYNDKASKPLTPEQRKRKIIVCWDRGLSTDDIAKYVGRKKTYIYEVLRPAMKQKRKERAERDMRILELYEQGLTQQKIAEKVGVSRERVTQIINNVNVSANGKTNKICKLNNSKNLGHEHSHKRESLTENQHSPEAGPLQVEPNPSTSSMNTANALQNEQAKPEEEASSAFLERAEIISFSVQDKSLVVFPGGGDSSHSQPTKSSHPNDGNLKQLPDNSTAGDIRDISSYLNSLNIYKKLSPENKKAIRAMELVKLYGQDVI
ncbi:MAG: hypothetical protein DRG82_09155, partial [Deltaproteobacteria bacterium]